MRVRIKGDVVNSKGFFKAGGVYDFPETDAIPLIIAGSAVEVNDEPKPEPKPVKEPKPEGK